MAGCGVGADTWTLRFRLNVRIFAAGRSWENASVYRAVYTRNPEGVLNRPSEFNTQAWGEALIMDVGTDLPLFGMLGGLSGVEGPSFDPGREYSVTRLLPRNVRTTEDVLSGRIYDIALATRESLVVPPDLWPTFVRFENLADKNSARIVIPSGQRYRTTPATPRQSLESICGPGARIESVTVTMTDENPSSRIARPLPWVDDLPGVRGGLQIIGGPSDPIGQRFEYRHFVMRGYAR